jgi:hypothetical protein
MTDTQHLSAQVHDHIWINPYSLMIKVIPGAGILEPTQNYYYYDYKESSELVVHYAKLLPQAETLIQLHYTHLMPIVTRANDIFVRSLLKSVSTRPDMSDSHIIALCIVRDSENIRFVPHDDIVQTLESGLAEGELWTEVIANYPVINEDCGVVPGFLQQAIANKGKSRTYSDETINTLVALMNRASEAYNIGRIELDKMLSNALAMGSVRSGVSDKFHIVNYADSGDSTKCDIKLWDSKISDNKLSEKQKAVTALRQQYDIAVNTLRTECAIQKNLDEFANGAMMDQVVTRLQNPTSHPDDNNQLVLCFLGKYIEKCTIRENKQIGVYNPEYLKFMSGLLEKGYHILPMNIEVTVTKNIINNQKTACFNETIQTIQNQEYSYRSRIARVASVINVESILYSCEPFEIAQTECTTMNDIKVTQITSKYIATTLLIW